MVSLRLFESKVIGSFNRIKQDMMNLWNTINLLKQEQLQINAKIDSADAYGSLDRLELSQLRQKIESLEKAMENGAKPQKFVLNKKNHKLHENSCLFAKKIKPENQIIIDGEDELLETRYVRCACMGA